MAKAYGTATPVTFIPTEDIKPLSRRPAVDVRKKENRDASLGVASMLLGALILFVTGWLMWEVFTRWTHDWRWLSLIAMAGIVPSVPLIYYGRLAMWRNTLDEWEESKAKKRLLAYSAQLEQRVDALTAQVDELTQRNEQLSEEMNRTVFVQSHEGRRVIDATAEASDKMRHWITTEIFDDKGKMIGVREKTGRIIRQYPFRSATHADPANQEADRRLKALGLVVFDSVYYWRGPKRLTEALERIQ